MVAVVTYQALGETGFLLFWIIAAWVLFGTFILISYINIYAYGVYMYKRAVILTGLPPVQIVILIILIHIQCTYKHVPSN